MDRNIWGQPVFQGPVTLQLRLTHGGTWLCRPLKSQGHLWITGRRGLTGHSLLWERKWVSRMGRCHPTRGPVFAQPVPAGNKNTQREREMKHPHTKDLASRTPSLLRRKGKPPEGASFLEKGGLPYPGWWCPSRECARTQTLDANTAWRLEMGGGAGCGG